MSEVPGANQPSIDLLPSQRLIRSLSDELLAGTSLPEIEHVITANAGNVRADIGRTTLQDMLVPTGLSLRPDPEHYRHYNLPSIRVGTVATLESVSFGTLGVLVPCRRFVLKDDLEELFDRDNVEFLSMVMDHTGDGALVEFLDESTWAGYVHVTFWHKSPDHRLGERLIVRSNHAHPGKMPTIEGAVAIPSRYAASGATTYPRLERPAANETEIAIVANTIRSLMMPTPPPAAST